MEKGEGVPRQSIHRESGPVGHADANIPRRNADEEVASKNQVGSPLEAIARDVLADGHDPSLAKRPAKAAKAAASANTFDAIASELLDKKWREAKADRTLGKLDWLLGLARPAIGARPIGGLLAYRELDDALGLRSTSRPCLSDNPNGTLAFRDELVSLLKNLDREEQVSARGFFLTANSHSTVAKPDDSTPRSPP